MRGIEELTSGFGAGYKLENEHCFDFVLVLIFAGRRSPCAVLPGSSFISNFMKTVLLPKLKEPAYGDHKTRGVVPNRERDDSDRSRYPDYPGTVPLAHSRFF